MNPFLSFLVDALGHLPRQAMATVARQVLANLAVKIEGSTTGEIAHQAEVYAIGQLDALLAQIEASSSSTPTLPAKQ